MQLLFVGQAAVAPPFLLVFPYLSHDVYCGHIIAELVRALGQRCDLQGIEARQSVPAKAPRALPKRRWQAEGLTSSWIAELLLSPHCARGTELAVSTAGWTAISFRRIFVHNGSVLKGGKRGMISPW